MYELTFATWMWLLIPMPLLIVLSLITFVVEGKTSKAKGEK
ncbi:hypothetical protein [Salsuginibacillus halophilus]|nr:hypothetical protein [Salsuginibacillus halophilus]